MTEKNYTNLIPENIEGKEITAIASANFDSGNQAISQYGIARERLLLISDWHTIAGSISARFQLTDLTGNEVQRAAEKGDHIRIDIPGPGSKAGEGYDWVRIEEIKEINSKDIDSIAIMVRPASNPGTDNNNIAHFYDEQSTSTFVVTRENNKVSAAIYDRNIESNKETKEPLDKVRNAVVGLGAKHGFSKLQWQALAEGLLSGMQ
jgi:hypothetical protein